MVSCAGSWLPWLLLLWLEQLALDSRAFVNHQGWVSVCFKPMRFAAIGLVGVPRYLVIDALIACDCFFSSFGIHQANH
jgi:hypothetical protein